MGIQKAERLEPGRVASFAGNAVPSGWLKANGALVSRATYAALFNAIGTVYGAGDGVATFALPDARGEFIRGFDDARGVDSGRVFGSAQADQMPSHTHVSDALDIAGSAACAGGANPVAAKGTQTGATGGTTNASENRPRNLAMLICIKY